MNKAKTVYIDWENWWIRTLSGKRLGEVSTYVNTSGETTYRVLIPVNDVLQGLTSTSKDKITDFIRQWCEPRGYTLLPKSLENML